MQIQIHSNVWDFRLDPNLPRWMFTSKRKKIKSESCATISSRSVALTFLDLRPSHGPVDENG